MRSPRPSVGGLALLIAVVLLVGVLALAWSAAWPTGFRGVVAHKHDDDRLHRRLRGLEIRLDRRVTIEQVAELHRRPAPLALPATINDIDRAQQRQQRQQRGWSRVHVADQQSRPEQASLQACQPVEKDHEY